MSTQRQSYFRVRTAYISRYGKRHFHINFLFGLKDTPTQSHSYFSVNPKRHAYISTYDIKASPTQR